MQYKKARRVSAGQKIEITRLSDNHPRSDPGYSGLFTVRTISSMLQHNFFFICFFYMKHIPQAPMAHDYEKLEDGFYIALMSPWAIILR